MANASFDTRFLILILPTECRTNRGRARKDINTLEVLSKRPGPTVAAFINQRHARSRHEPATIFTAITSWTNKDCRRTLSRPKIRQQRLSFRMLHSCYPVTSSDTVGHMETRILVILFRLSAPVWEGVKLESH
jgi:hypothetical protein